MIRILHTGDWHVGKGLRGRSRADEHRAVLQEIAAIAADGPVDLILIAGDLFDSSAPTAEAESIVYQALLALGRSGAPIVIVAGNHDNPQRLQAVRPLLELTDIHVAPWLARPDQGGVRRIATRNGEVGLALLPWLSQRAIVRADALMRDDADQHAGVYAERMQRLVEGLCRALPDETVNLLLGHAMVHGGRLAGGEREAHTVFEYSVPATSFPPGLHYVALGHLHGAQRIEGGCPVEYSGSPLQLDFGETAETKSVTLIEAAPGRPVRVERVPLSSGRPLRTVRGKPEALEQLADEVGDAFLRVQVEAQAQPGLAERVREMLPNAVDVRLVGAGPRPVERRPSRRGRPPQELFAEYLADKQADDPRLRALFGELLEEVHAPDPA